MKTVLRDAMNQFEEIQSLLKSGGNKDNDYFTKLSIATEEAYFTMNAGMCSNTTICKDCSENRDFVHTMMELLASLETDSTKAPQYSSQLSEYSLKVNDILSRITSVISKL